jgi:hypothetical protein
MLPYRVSAGFGTPERRIAALSAIHCRFWTAPAAPRDAFGI